MRDVVYITLEYLAWIAVALVAGIVLYVCLAIGLAISSWVNPLAQKWKLISKAKRSSEPEPVPVSSVRSFLLHAPKRFHKERAESKPVVNKVQAPESSEDLKRRAG